MLYLIVPCFVSITFVACSATQKTRRVIPGLQYEREYDYLISMDTNIIVQECPRDMKLYNPPPSGEGKIELGRKLEF